MVVAEVLMYTAIGTVAVVLCSVGQSAPGVPYVGGVTAVPRTIELVHQVTLFHGVLLGSGGKEAAEAGRFEVRVQLYVVILCNGFEVFFNDFGEVSFVPLPSYVREEFAV